MDIYLSVAMTDESEVFLVFSSGMRVGIAGVHRPGFGVVFHGVSLSLCIRINYRLSISFPSVFCASTAVTLPTLYRHGSAL